MSRSSGIPFFISIAALISVCSSAVCATGLTIEAKPGAQQHATKLRAYNHITHGDYDSAIPLLKKAVKVKPDDPEAHRYLAFSYLRKGLVTQALTEQKQVMNSGKELPHDHFALGEANFYDGKPKEAIKSYKEALIMNPLFVEARIGVIRSLQALGKNREAKAICEDAAYNSPDFKSKGQFKKLLNEMNAHTQIASTANYGS